MKLDEQQERSWGPGEEPGVYAHDEEACASWNNMYIGCPGENKYPLKYFPRGWKHLVRRERLTRTEHPGWSETFGPVRHQIMWRILQNHRFMMTDYDHSPFKQRHGYDPRQALQMVISKFVSWYGRNRLPGTKEWQYNKTGPEVVPLVAKETWEAAVEISNDLKQLLKQLVLSKRPDMAPKLTHPDLMFENWEKPDWEYREHPEAYYSPRNQPRPIHEKDVGGRKILLRVRKRDETANF